MNERISGTADARIDHNAIVAGLRPLIVAAEDQIERDGIIPPHLVDAMWDSGVFRALLPATLDGLEMHPVEWLDLIFELTRINGSVGWLAVIQSGGTVFLEPDVMKDIVARGRWLVSGGLGRLGKASAVDGGYRFSGRWNFCTGLPHATHLVGFAQVYGEDDEPVLDPDTGAPRPPIGGVFPADEVTTHPGQWSGLGLRGSGSDDFEVTDLFVPHDLVITRPFAFSDAYRTRPLYRYPFVELGHAAVGLGLGRAAIDAFVELANRTAAEGSSRQARFGADRVQQIALAKADAIIRAARAFTWDVTGRAYADAEQREIIDYELRVQIVQANVYAVHAARDAMNLVFRQAGTDGVISGRKLERIYRDLSTAAQHTASSETVLATVGQYYLTRDRPEGPTIDTSETFITGPHPQDLRDAA